MPEIIEQGPTTIQPQQPDIPESGADKEIQGSAEEVGGSAEAKVVKSEAGKAHATAPESEESFFDFESIKDKPELMAAYKQMQGAFTKKTQAIAGGKQKVEAYDAFMRDPVGELTKMAKQYGLVVNRAGAAIPEKESGAAGADAPFAPQSWDEVFSEVEKRAEQRIMERLAPMLGTVKEMHKTSVESQLEGIDPNWRVHEDEMLSNMRAHPSLVNDVAKLYRISVPEEVLMQKATQQALRKIEGKVDAAKVHGSARTSKTSKPGPQIKTFDDAVREAERQLAGG